MSGDSAKKSYRRQTHSLEQETKKKTDKSFQQAALLDVMNVIGPRDSSSDIKMSHFMEAA